LGLTPGMRIAPWIVKELPALMKGSTSLGVVSNAAARLPWVRMVSRGPALRRGGSVAMIDVGMRDRMVGLSVELKREVDLDKVICGVCRAGKQQIWRTLSPKSFATHWVKRSCRRTLSGN
jgi:hypothetical protein